MHACCCMLLQVLFTRSFLLQVESRRQAARLALEQVLGEHAQFVQPAYCQWMFALLKYDPTHFTAFWLIHHACTWFCRTRTTWRARCSTLRRSWSRASRSSVAVTSPRVSTLTKRRRKTSCRRRRRTGEKSAIESSALGCAVWVTFQLQEHDRGDSRSHVASHQRQTLQPDRSGQNVREDESLWDRVVFTGKLCKFSVRFKVLLSRYASVLLSRHLFKVCQPLV